jgi:hypothetical protein
VSAANAALKRARTGPKCNRCGKMLYNNHKCSNPNGAAVSAAPSSQSSSSIVPPQGANVPVSAASAPQNVGNTAANVDVEHVAESNSEHSSVFVEDDDSDHEPDEETKLENDADDEEENSQEGNDIKILLKQKGRNGKQIE